jgi:hypothetical protein
MSFVSAPKRAADRDNRGVGIEDLPHLSRLGIGDEDAVAAMLKGNPIAARRDADRAVFGDRIAA